MSIYKTQSIQFIVMIIVGMLFNPMNILAYRINDLYISLTLFYGGILMASNMVWAHEIIHYLSMGHFNMGVFIIGIIMSVATSILLLRKQLCVGHVQKVFLESSRLFRTNSGKQKDPYGLGFRV